ncbi:MAG: beta-eliminating lyase-related protein [Boseongicola sp.]|nr:beta-eliminating lyase-related protein [Boseongicola sp.]
MNFASDNTGAVHPKVMEMLQKANEGYAMPYGADAWTAKAEDMVRDVFEAPDAAVFLVSNGTAANSLCLATYANPWDTVFCSRFAHAHVDECNAPEFFAGGIKITTVGEAVDKFSGDDLEQAIAQWDPDNIQNPALGPVSITQITERGTLYSIDEILAITKVAKAHGLMVHMDGARFANASVALNFTAAEITWKSGVGAVSFGGTKNGLMGVEAAILFDAEKAHEFARRRKRGAQRMSKNRYLAAQMVAYLTDDLWRETAAAANSAAAQLVKGLNAIEGVTLPFKPEANMVYAWMPRRIHERLKDAGAMYYIEAGQLVGDDPEELLLARFVCDWAVKDAEIDRFLEVAAS